MTTEYEWRAEIETVLGREATDAELEAVHNTGIAWQSDMSLAFSRLTDALHDAGLLADDECRHDTVDLAMDPLDPARERLDAGTCADCGAEVHLEPTGDGDSYWEID